MNLLTGSEHISLIKLTLPLLLHSHIVVVVVASIINYPQRLLLAFSYGEDLLSAHINDGFDHTSIGSAWRASRETF